MTDYYVRPPGAHANTANGTAYANAWLGMNNVVWGASGVQAGDTLYICDDWRRVQQTGYSQTSLVVGASGSSGNLITIRGDRPGTPGIMCNAITGNSGGTWTEVGTSGAYQFSLTSGTWDRWMHDGVILPFVESGTYSDPPTESELNGMSEGYSYYDATNSVRYVKLSGTADPSGEDMIAYLVSAGIHIETQDYIEVKNLTINTGAIVIYQSDNVTIDNVSISTTDVGIVVDDQDTGDQCTGLVIKNCSFEWAGDGIYSYYGATGITIQNCTFDNIIDLSTTNYLSGGTSPDNHAIGIMGFPNHLVEDCTFYNAGTAVTLYSGYTANDPGITIRRCWADTMRRDPEHTNNGILDGHGAAYDIHTSGGIDVGAITFKVHGCVAINCDNSGIRALDNPTSTSSKIYDLYGNTIVGCQIGIAMSSSDSNAIYKTKNNLIVDPTDRANGLTCAFVHWYTGTVLDMDYNCFATTDVNWPSTSTLMFERTGYVSGNSLSWSSWKATASSPDGNSLTADPLFIDKTGKNYQLKQTSPCVNAGTSTSIAFDYRNLGRPYGPAEDVGAYEMRAVGRSIRIDERLGVRM